MTWRGGQRAAQEEDWDRQFGPDDPYAGAGYSGGYPVGDYQSGGYPAGGSGEYAAGGPGGYAGRSLDSRAGDLGAAEASPGHEDFGSTGFDSTGFDSGSFGSGTYGSGTYGSGGLASAGSGGYPATDFASGEYQATGYAGGGYRGDDRYGGDSGSYPAGDFEQGFYAEPGFDDSAPAGRRGRGRLGRRGRSPDLEEPGFVPDGPEGAPGYPPDEDWYGAGDDSQAWAAEGLDDEDFLPGPGPGSRRRASSPPGRGRGQSRPGRTSKRKRGLRRPGPWVVMIALLLVFGSLALGGYHFWRTYISPADYSGSGTGSVVVRVLPGDSATAIGDRLQQLGVVASSRAFANAAKASPRGQSLEPGYYRLHHQMQASLALALLLKPSSRVQFKVVIPEGWRLSQIITRFGKETGNSAGYQQAVKNADALGLPSFAHGKPEGYLFPATYILPPGTPPGQVLQAMAKRFRQEAQTVHLPATAAHDQLSQADVITVASLVQAEGRNAQDFPKIARVIYNRLNSGMKLQLDSTVFYALHRYGILASNQQLKVNSPYNTYQHTGLPPGPIDSPGDAAIRAALHPATGNWLYFVTVNPKTGQTEFTSDPAQFDRLRAELQKNLGNG